ncbi:MATE family efflux transporter [Sphingomonas swuensis]|uniref:Multidrug-efflux transporter n=1 Tax=Sphingomonas swuensis TaxID=977800 RepID=A0ABP7SGF3_9SPHN
MPVLVEAPKSTREEVSAMLRLAWPLVLANLAGIAITTTDVLMLGRLGARELASSALAVNLYSLVMFSGTGLAVGAAPLIAAALGRRRHAIRDSRRTFRMGIWLVGVYCLAGWLLLWNSERLFLLLGQDPVLSEGAGRFARVLMWALLPALLVALFRTALTAFDRTLVALAVALGGVAVNAVLNWMLIFGYWGAPALGLTGSALASLITTLLMALAMGLVLHRSRTFRRMHLFGRWWRFDRQRFVELAKVGVPIGIVWAFEVSVFSCAVFLMGLIDTTSVAAHVIALQLASVSFMVPLGLAQAVTVRIGIAYGAGDRAWVGLAGKVALAVAMAFMSVAASIIWLFPGELAGLFLSEGRPENAAVLALAVKFLLIAAVFQLADGAQVVGAAMLRGLQDTRVPMLYAAFGYWAVGLGSGVGLAFGAGWRGEGIWTGLALGLAVVSVLMLWRWSRREKLGLVEAR